MNDPHEIWREVHQGLRAFIAKRVADEASVEDLSQEVFVRMQRGLDGLKNESRLVAWIYQIARHAIIDYYRARNRQPERPVGLASELETLYPASLPVESSEGSGHLRTELWAIVPLFLCPRPTSPANSARNWPAASVP